MSKTARLLWRHHTGAENLSVALAPDGSRVYVGAGDGRIHCLDRSGKVEWTRKVAGNTVFRVALAEDAGRLVVATFDSGKIAVLDLDGNQIWIRSAGETVVFSLAVSRSGERVFAGAKDGRITAWDRDGRPLWVYQTGGAVRGVDATPDGATVVAGAEDNRIYCLNGAGALEWSYLTDGAVWAGAAVSSDGQFVAGGSNDHSVYFLDRAGQLLWRREAGRNVNRIAMDSLGARIFAGCEDGSARMYDIAGQLLWSNSASAGVYGACVSADGEFAVAGSDDQVARLFNEPGETLFEHKLDGRPYGAAVTPGGRLFALAGRDGYVYLFENLLAPPDAARVDTAYLVSRGVVRRVRRAYIKRPVLGLCHWFDEFDQLLARGQRDLCEALLREAREQEYPFTPAEWRYVDSREGALWLSRGIAHQRQREYDLAEQAFQRSLALQQQLRHPAAEGETRMALSLLAEERATGRRDPLLERMAAELTVLGGSSTLLTGRLAGLSAGEQREILRSAMQQRKTQPLAAAMSAKESSSRAAAAAALARFEELEPDDAAALLAGADDPHWFVRWRAADALGQNDDADRDRVPHLADTLRAERDPEARRALAEALGRIGDPRATAALAEALADIDADVRWAAATALAQAGNRAALPALASVRDGKDFFGRSPQEAARSAASEIEARYPKPEIRKMWAARVRTETGELMPDTLFRSDEAITFVAEVAAARAGTRFRLRCSRVNSDGSREAVAQQEATFAGVSDSASQQAEPPPLVEFVDGSATSEVASRFRVGARVRCVAAGASARAELRVGDTGTVRGLGHHPPLGVEWDRDIGGHGGNMYFTCPPGHGWYVMESDVELLDEGPPAVSVPEHALTCELRPLGGAAGAKLANYVAVIEALDGASDEGEPCGETNFAVAHVTIEEALLCLEVSPSGIPGPRANGVRAGRGPAYCWVSISPAPAGTEVLATISMTRPYFGAVLKLKVKTSTSSQPHIWFELPRSGLKPGRYEITLRPQGGPSYSLPLEVWE